MNSQLPKTKKEIYCVECETVVSARLTDGKEVYPHREDLYTLPFWKCDVCGNHVGCHHKTDNPTNPLGVIANKELKRWRIRIHDVLDPLWRDNNQTRQHVYTELNKRLGYHYHTAEIRSVEEAKRVLEVLEAL